MSRGSSNSEEASQSVPRQNYMTVAQMVFAVDVVEVLSEAAVARSRGRFCRVVEWSRCRRTAETRNEPGSNRKIHLIRYAANLCLSLVVL
jgi:hypothetical protein